MNPEPLQVILRYGNSVKCGNFEAILDFLNEEVRDCINKGSKWTKNFSNVACAVEMENINPTTAGEINRLTEEDLAELLQELTSKEWGLLDNVISVLA